MKKLVLLFTIASLVLGSIAFITKSIPGTSAHIAKVVGLVNDQQIVGDGIFLPKGMPKFGGRLSQADIANIKGYILAAAKKNRESK